MPVIRDTLARVKKGSYSMPTQTRKSGCQLAAKTQMLAEEAILYTVFCSIPFFVEIKEDSAAGCLSKPTSEDCQALSHRNVSQAEPIEVDFFCSTAAEPGAAEGNDEEG